MKQRGIISPVMIGYLIVAGVLVSAGLGFAWWVQDMRLTIARQEVTITALKGNVDQLKAANKTLELANERQSAATQALADARQDAMNASRSAWAAVAKANAEKASIEARFAAAKPTGDECRDLQAAVDVIRAARAERGWP